MTSSREMTLLNEHDMTALIKVNQKLHELGIHKTIRLPQICVVGDQSAGKSSLIEALSKIKVPRAANCCTQCPLSINISSGEQSDSPWRCTIVIENRFDFEEVHRMRKPSNAHPMGPWSPVAYDPKLHAKIFKSTDDKYEVCELITAAQRSILNPDRAMKDFIPGPHQRLPVRDTVKFSPNVVRIDITEGCQASLSFIDLPGVISNTEVAEDQYLVDLVKNLVKSYARNPETINILTLPMTTDIANSNSLRLIQIIHAEKRTMAVLTKPDRVTDDAERKQFLDKFEHQSDSLYEHGYHVCMMPPDVTLSYRAARSIEMNYFEKEPWRTMDNDLKSKLGVENVRSYIRELLFTKTREKLPENLRSIELRLDEIEKRLTFLPAPPDANQLPFIIFRHLAKFEENMTKLFFGHDNTETISLRREFNQICQEFRKSVVDSKPTLLFQTSSERARLEVAQNKIEEFRLTANKKTGRHGDAVDVSSGDEDSSTVVKGEVRAQILPYRNNRNGLVCRFTLDEIRDMNRKYDNAGLPGQCYPKAKEDMMRLSVQAWNERTETLMDNVKVLIMQHVEEQKQLAFGDFKDYQLHNEVTNWISKYLRDAIKDELHNALCICDVEISQPFTMDAEMMAEKSEVCLKDRVSKRDAWRLKVQQTELLASAGGKPRAKQPSDTQLPVDDYKTEVEMSATVRAYYEIASSRFTDCVCQGMLARLFPSCGQRLAQKLQEHLSVHDPKQHDLIKHLMSESPERQQERESLLREQVQLSEGKKYIETVLGHGRMGNGDEMDIDDNNQGLVHTPRTTRTTIGVETPSPSQLKRGRSGTATVKPTHGDDAEVLVVRDSSPAEPPSTTKKIRRTLRNTGMGH